MLSLIGKKIGMTTFFTKNGTLIPISIVKVKKNYIINIRKNFKNDYLIKVTSEKEKKFFIKKSHLGIFKKLKIPTYKFLHEFKIKQNDLEKFNVGKSISVVFFSNFKKVDITGTSKGKGFSGVIKRWNFSSQDASHGNSLSHRAPGSIGQNQTPGRVFKGKKMPGHLGNKKVTIQNIDIIKIDCEENIMFLKGAIPGYNGNNVIIKPSIKYYGS